MKLKIEINLNGAALSEGTGGELAVVLTRALDNIRYSEGPEGWEPATGTMRDTNGNTVGDWTISDEDL